jgi:hypothetical protein
MGNDDARVALVAHKRHGHGDPLDQWVTATLRDIIALVPPGSVRDAQAARPAYRPAHPGGGGPGVHRGQPGEAGDPARHRHRHRAPLLPDGLSGNPAAALDDDVTGGRVPDEWVEALRGTRAFQAASAFGVPEDAYDNCARLMLDAVLPLVAAERDRAVKDALWEAHELMAREIDCIADKPMAWHDGLARGQQIVADLRDGAR